MRKITNELREILTISEESVKCNEYGELILPLRKKIYKALDENSYYNCKKDEATLGKKRRVELGLLAVYKVMHVWEKNILEDNRPKKILQKVKEYIDGNCSKEAVDNTIGCFQTDLLDILTEDTDTIIAVGFATLKVAARATCNDECLEDQGELDDDLDCECWDEFYHASIAYSGGAKWQSKSNIEKRREFWLWFLEEAVPKAYMEFPDNKK